MNYINIGYTQKTHGLNGELKLHVSERYIEDFLKCERIFLDMKGAKVPYFIEEVRGKGSMILKLEEVDDRDAAYSLQSKEVFLREEDILSDAAREIELPVGLTYGHLLGAEIIDQHTGSVGIIDEVLDMPQQEMAAVQYKGRLVLIPLNERFIKSIDTKAKKVEMDLPDGLLDM